MVAVLSKKIKEQFGYLGLFLSISAWGILALLVTLIYPVNPTPQSQLKKLNKSKQSHVVEADDANMNDLSQEKQDHQQQIEIAKLWYKFNHTWLPVLRHSSSILQILT